MGKDKAKEPKAKLGREAYEKKLAELQEEVTHLQAWVRTSGARVAIVFEGRDAAGKGGVIRRLTERVSPRVFRVAALPTPTEREKSQLYLQRYVQHFPAGGEVVIFDRSWYNRAGVERVMGFCTPEQTEQFLQRLPAFEAYLVEQGIILLKYFLTVSEEEQRKRFLKRIHDPMRQWKLSPMDVESYRRWWDYTAAYDEMIRRTDTEVSPWRIVASDDKRRARLNCIADILASVPYERTPFQKPKLGKRAPKPADYVASAHPLRMVPDVV